MNPFISYRSIGGYAPTDPRWEYTGDHVVIGNGTEPLTAPRGKAMRVIAPSYGDVVRTQWQGLSWQARVVAFAVRMAAPFAQMQKPDYVANPDGAEPGWALLNSNGTVVPSGTVRSFGPERIGNDWTWLIYDLGRDYHCTGIRMDWQALTLPGHLDIGFLWVGNYYEVSNGFDAGYGRDRADKAEPQISDGGQAYYSVSSEPQRRIRLQLSLQREAEDIITQTSGLMRIRDELDGRGHKRPVLIVPRTNGPVKDQMAFVGYTEWSEFGHATSQYWGSSITHTEMV